MTGDNDVIGREGWEVYWGSGGGSTWEGGAQPVASYPTCISKSSVPACRRPHAGLHLPLILFQSPCHTTANSQRHDTARRRRRLPKATRVDEAKKDRGPRDVFFFLCHLHVCDFNDRRRLDSRPARIEALGGALIHLACGVHMHTHAPAHGINIA